MNPSSPVRQSSEDSRIAPEAWYRQDVAAVLGTLGVDPNTGLGAIEADKRLAEFGRNELSSGGARSPWRILFDQLKELMVVILIAAAVISAFLKDIKDAIAIGAIVVLNAILGFSQEYRAEKAIAALKKLSVPLSRVRRDGEVREISSIDLVPGDILLLETGNLIPADGRVVESIDLQTAEAALTGESEPVAKEVRAIDETGLTVGDRRNMVFRGTFVTAGRGLVVVTETGMKTELGSIAAMLSSVEQEMTPLQRRLAQLAKSLAIAALSIVAVIFILGVIRGEEIQLMLLTAVSIGVAAVPEGLPTVVTIALTLGAQRMLKRKVLVRRLAAVETLGSVNVICSDKTGTLTENRMTASSLHLPLGGVDVSSGASLEDAAAAPGVRLLLAGGALCNDSVASADPSASANGLIGDPTETALAAVAARFGLDKSALERVMPRVAELAFDSNRKRMTTVHQVGANEGKAIVAGLADSIGAPAGSRVAFTKGAVDGLLGITTEIWVDSAAETLDDQWRAKIVQASEGFARQGMRVLGVAMRRFGAATPAKPAGIEKDLTWLGMLALIDPPRAEVAGAVATCQSAGIRTIMITGDHPLTAGYIGRQLGIATDRPPRTGIELERLQDHEIEQLAEKTDVYARVSPAHKLKIVEGLQRTGNIVAMTGDGVNDAPALKRADIGVAMGLTGTDVAKEAADMVLLDDNFATIVAAVEEGRVIYDNIRKFIKYMLATNSAEIWIMLIAPLIGMPLPLLPLQILWMNLVTDGLPALALGVEPAEAHVMRRPPYAPNEHIFSRGLGRHVIWVGLLMSVLCLGLGYSYWRVDDPKWQTVLFTTLTFSQMTHVMAIRSERASLFSMGVLSNNALFGAVMLTCVLQVALIYVPFLQSFFTTVALPAFDFGLTVLFSLLVFVAVEIEKWVIRRSPAPAVR